MDTLLTTGVAEIGADIRTVPDKIGQMWLIIKWGPHTYMKSLNKPEIQAI